VQHSALIAVLRWQFFSRRFAGRVYDDSIVPGLNLAITEQFSQYADPDAREPFF
jgi:hypothetical protein